MNRRLSLLLGGSLAFWLLTAVPAARLWGEDMYAYSLVAAGLCVLPTLLVMLGADRALLKLPPQLILLGGTGLRMAVVLGAGVLLSVLVPFFGGEGLFAFWGWILIFYLFTLVLEIAGLLGGPVQVRSTVN